MENTAPTKQQVKEIMSQNNRGATIANTLKRYFAANFKITQTPNKQEPDPSYDFAVSLFNTPVDNRGEAVALGQGVAVSPGL